jgi:hypothetical protein
VGIPYLLRDSKVRIRLDQVCIVAVVTLPLCHETIDFALVALEIGLEMQIRQGSDHRWGPPNTHLFVIALLDCLLHWDDVVFRILGRLRHAHLDSIELLLQVPAQLIVFSSQSVGPG